MYFGKNVDQSIAHYLAEPDRRLKDKIYKDEIYPALAKLTENVFFNRNFHNFGQDSFSDFKHECIVHLTERLEKFDSTLGHRAFSYFNRTAINWVWANMRRVGEDTYGRCELDAIDIERDLHAETRAGDYQEELRDFCSKWSEWGTEFLDYFYFVKNGNVVPFPKKEKQVANAIFNLFKNSSSIDIYNKKALYILIREQVNVKTQTITDVVNVLRPLCKEMYFDFKQNGTRYWHRFLYYPEEIELEDNYIEEMFKSQGEL